MGGGWGVDGGVVTAAELSYVLRLCIAITPFPPLLFTYTNYHHLTEIVLITNVVFLKIIIF